MSKVIIINNIRAENRHQQIVVNHELNISQKPTPPKSIYINHAIIKHNRSPAVNGTHYSTPLRHLISKKKARFRLFYETFAKYCVISLPAEPTNLINSHFLDFHLVPFQHSLRSDRQFLFGLHVSVFYIAFSHNFD